MHKEGILTEFLHSPTLLKSESLTRALVEMLIYPLPPQESAAALFCNYSFFKGQVHRLVCREKQQSQRKSRVAELSQVQRHKYIGTQTLQQHRRATILPPLSTTSLLLFLTFNTHLFFCNPCFPNTHQHNSHTFPLYSISICNSQGISQKATNKLLPPPRVTQRIRT